MVRLEVTEKLIQDAGISQKCYRTHFGPLAFGRACEIESRDRTSSSDQNLEFLSMPKYVTSDMWQEILIKSRIILVSSSTHSYRADFHHSISIQSFNHPLPSYPHPPISLSCDCPLVSSPIFFFLLLQMTVSGKSS